MSNDTYVTPDGVRMRMINDNILVRADKPAQATASGLIHFPEGAVEDINNTGTVLAFGYTEDDDGNRIPIPDLEVGMKVVFIRFLAEQDSNKQIRTRFGKDLIRLKPSDILLMYTEDEAGRLT